VQIESVLEYSAKECMGAELFEERENGAMLLLWKSSLKPNGARCADTLPPELKEL
jgi:hypothetical protein